MKAVGAALLLAGIVIALFLSIWVGAILAIVGVALLMFTPKPVQSQIDAAVSAALAQAGVKPANTSECDICGQPDGIHMSNCSRYDWTNPAHTRPNRKT